VLCACAGVGEHSRLGEMTEEHFDAAVSLNARGTLFTVQKALPLFNDGGSIFMTGSNASLRGYPNWSVYAGSKAVLPAYARVWVSELRDRKIRVNVLTPGQVGSPMLAKVMDEEAKAQFESVIPRREMGRPEEIASAALFLASDDSSYVNGMELVVDGGTTVI
jgi:NAD(P)-dependent dehydrogenase (short-subunit alcohol dehydrogenase family)